MNNWRKKQNNDQSLQKTQPKNPNKTFPIYLKPANIVIISKQGSKPINRLSFRIPGTESNAHVDQALNSIRPEQTEPPSNHSPPVMGHQEHLLNTQMAKQAHQVSDYVHGRVRRRGRRGIRVAEAAEVGGYAAVAEGGEGE